MITYPFMTLDDQTEIVHSEWLPNDTVRVYVEKTDEKDGFHSASHFLPAYQRKDVQGFSEQEIAKYQKIIESTAPLILRFAQEWGFEHAASL